VWAHAVGPVKVGGARTVRTYTGILRGKRRSVTHFEARRCGRTRFDGRGGQIGQGSRGRGMGIPWNLCGHRSRGRAFSE